MPVRRVPNERVERRPGERVARRSRRGARERPRALPAVETGAHLLARRRIRTPPLSRRVGREEPTLRPAQEPRSEVPRRRRRELRRGRWARSAPLLRAKRACHGRQAEPASKNHAPASRASPARGFALSKHREPRAPARAPTQFEDGRLSPTGLGFGSTRPPRSHWTGGALAERSLQLPPRLRRAAPPRARRGTYAARRSAGAGASEAWARESDSAGPIAVRIQAHDEPAAQVANSRVGVRATWATRAPKPWAH